MVKLDGYELIIGSSLDPQFGPVLLFGTGGQLVEVFKDRALALPPLNTTLARRMMEQTKIFTALKGVRGRRPVDLAALEQLLVRFSQLVVEQPWIKEIDINPLLASPERLLALDARVILHEPDVRGRGAPAAGHPPLPEPVRHLLDRQGRQHSSCSGRSAPRTSRCWSQFHGTLSERSVSLRYFHAMKLEHAVAHERLTRICFIDYDREMALVADREDPETGEPRDPRRRPAEQGPRDRRGRVRPPRSATSFRDEGSAPSCSSRLIQIGRDEKHRPDLRRSSFPRTSRCSASARSSASGSPTSSTTR